MIHLLPIMAAIFWALHYVLLERTLETLSMATIVMLIAVVLVVTAMGIAMAEGDPISLAPLKQPRMLILVGAMIVTQIIAAMCTNYGIKLVSATYAALGEVSYPLFIPLFAFLLFGWRQWNTQILIGGSLIMIGVYILIHGQFKLTNAG